MLKKKKRTKSSGQTLQDIFWPKMGWRRVFRYYGLRLYRLNDTPYAIAAGVSSGVAVSFTPFIGLHILFSLGLARILNGSMIAAMIGTLAGNLWTFPLIWIFTYKIGLYILGTGGGDDLPTHLTLSELFKNPTLFLIPMMVGSLPCAIISWFLTFYPTRVIILRFQKRRDRRRARARLKEIKRHKKAQKRLEKAQSKTEKTISTHKVSE